MQAPRLKILAALLLVGVADARADAPSAEVFGHIPHIQNVALTPDGRTLAWQDNRAAQPAVVVMDLTSGELRRSLPVDVGTSLRRLSWADDETLLMDVSTTRAAERGTTAEFFRTLAVDVASGRVRRLLLDGPHRDAVTGAALLAARTARPHIVTMATWDFLLTHERPSIGTRLAGRRRDSGWISTVFAVDTRSGEADVLEFGSQFTDSWVVDASGRPVARSEWYPSTGEFRVLARDGLGWRLIHRQTDGSKLVLGTVSADGRSIVALGSNGTGRSKLWAMPLDGSGARILLEHPVHDVESIITDPLTRAPLAVQLGGLAQEIRWLDDAAEERARRLERTFPGRRVRLTGRSADGKLVLAQVESASRPPVFYLVDFTSGRADIAGETYPALERAKLGKVRPLTYRARDGAEIPGYLTLPPGARAERLPLVVLPHGGPESRDDFAFDWRAQFLATRGYAVLQPQFRGSTGFGDAHRRAGYREWGGIMQNDLTDGVRAMVAQGIADPRRVCIVGASYGGYAALAGVAFTPELYACAASINGISDLPALLGHTERQGGSESDAAAYWRTHIGERLDARLAARSPARAAARVRAPVLLMHASEDTVVPAFQSERMAGALAAHGRAHRHVSLEGEDHWLSATATRVRVLTALEAFLREHLGAADEH